MLCSINSQGNGIFFACYSGTHKFNFIFIMKTRAEQEGFNVIELMIVVTIIGIIASIAIPTFRDYMIEVKWAKAISNVAALKLAISHCLNDHSGNLPSCDSIPDKELDEYGISGFSPGNEDLYQINLVTGTAAIKIDGKAPLADCILSLTPDFNLGTGSLSWRYVMAGGGSAATTEKCINFVKGAVAS